MTKTAKQPSPEEFREELERAVSYLFDDELTDYLAAPSSDHIFPAVRTLAAWLKVGADVLASRKALEHCCELACIADRIEKADADDANGEGEWENSWQSAREAAEALQEVRRQLRQILHANAKPEPVGG
jgi:exonuclease VII small subunit